jgi:hypothetical protein
MKKTDLAKLANKLCKELSKIEKGEKICLAKFNLSEKELERLTAQIKELFPKIMKTKRWLIELVFELENETDEDEYSVCDYVPYLTKNIYPGWVRKTQMDYSTSSGWVSDWWYFIELYNEENK